MISTRRKNLFISGLLALTLATLSVTAAEAKHRATKGALIGAGVGAIVGGGKGAVAGGLAGAIIGDNS